MTGMWPSLQFTDFWRQVQELNRSEMWCRNKKWANQKVDKTQTAERERCSEGGKTPPWQLAIESKEEQKPKVCVTRPGEGTKRGCG